MKVENGAEAQDPLTKPNCEIFPLASPSLLLQRDLDLSLCPRCRVIDLDGVVEAAGAGEDLDSAIVARVAFAASFTDPTCRFCVFLSHGGLRSRFSWQGQSQPWKLCLFDSLRARGFPKTDDGTLETRSIVMALFPEGHTYC